MVAKKTDISTILARRGRYSQRLILLSLGILHSNLSERLKQEDVMENQIKSVNPEDQVVHDEIKNVLSKPNLWLSSGHCVFERTATLASAIKH